MNTCASLQSSWTSRSRPKCECNAAPRPRPPTCYACAQPVTLTYIFQFIQQWLCNKTAKILHIFSSPLYSMDRSGWVFPYWAQMITNIQGCVARNDFWRWPISFRSFSHDFTIKLLKYATYCCVCSTVCTVLDGFLTYFVQMITSMGGCVASNDLSPWPISSRSFSHDFIVKLLKYMVHLVLSTLQHIQFWMNSFHIWHKWSLSWDGVARHISSVFLIVTLPILWFLFMWQTQPVRGRRVMHHFQVDRSKVRVTRVDQMFAVGVGVSL